MQIERFFKRGFYFGNYNIFTGYPSEYSYTATAFIKAMAIPKQRFLKILDKYPQIKSAMLSYSFRLAKETSKAMVLSLSPFFMNFFENFFLE
jgi:CRP-like cAMP-binding protein